MEETIIYSDVNSLIEMYKMNDLPVDVLAFQYYIKPGHIVWVHRDELKKMIALHNAYPQANTQKSKK